MNRLYEGLDYLYYRIYIWGGIAALVAYCAVVVYVSTFTNLFHITDKEIFILIMVPVCLWVLGILAYWWWVFLFKGVKELEASLRESPTGPPEVSTLKSWGTLHTAMAIYGGNVDEMLAAEKAARLPVIIWFGMQNLLVLWIFCNAWVWFLFQEVLPANYVTRVWAPGVFVIMALFLVGTPFLVGKALKGGEAAYLAPLGLSSAESSPDNAYLSGILNITKAMTRSGIIVFSGSRRGRLVRIEAIGKHSYTWVGAKSPSFEIHSQDGKLVTGKDAPKTVAQSLHELRQAKRWKGIKVTAGPDGMGIERESPGENMWLYDLWLIERLLEADLGKSV